MVCTLIMFTLLMGILRYFWLYRTFGFEFDIFVFLDNIQFYNVLEYTGNGPDPDPSFPVADFRFGASRNTRANIRSENNIRFKKRYPAQKRYPENSYFSYFPLFFCNQTLALKCFLFRAVSTKSHSSL